MSKPFDRDKPYVPPHERELFAGHLFVASVPELVARAQYMAENFAVSYRDDPFKVGAAVFAVTGLFEINTEDGANVKPKRSRTTICAEKIALRKAEKWGATRAIGIVVAGTVDREKIKDVTDFASPTLHPCTNCQVLFDGHPLVRPDTLIVTAGLEVDTYQAHTYAELHDLYINQDARGLEEITTVRYLSDWERRVEKYDRLAVGELMYPPDERRSMSYLAKTALLAA